jgi:hypothetical protein
VIRGRAYFARVVDGQIVCACTDDPPVEECCMYPWPGDGIPLYPPEDLPATINIEGTILDHVPGEYLFLKVVGEDVTNVFSGSEGWISTGSFPTQTTPCLIGTNPGGTPIEDQFSGSYTVSFTHGGEPRSILVSRASLCVWGGEDESFVYSVQIQYNETTYQFEISISEFGFSLGGSAKDSPQSSPAGTYGDFGGVSGITVS